ncbi:hypothetical protein [Orenia marismortui]|uniref:Uncharacterized protein n=1 Tax=Orenia marismortui TaxID=46469 RepID=A0A4R8GR70_9FIRM|nr:hypothetical protein [Orenia marismortui]TDX48298.1 hypothetical protein C7959_13025 [Orenia marismortui]
MAVIETEVTVTAKVIIDDDICKGAFEQCGMTDKEKIAENILRIIVANGIEDVNNGVFFWDGVARLQQNISDFEVL